MEARQDFTFSTFLEILAASLPSSLWGQQLPFQLSASTKATLDTFSVPDAASAAHLVTSALRFVAPILREGGDPNPPFLTTMQTLLANHQERRSMQAERDQAIAAARAASERAALAQAAVQKQTLPSLSASSTRSSLTRRSR